MPEISPHVGKAALCLDCHYAVWPVHDFGICSAPPLQGLTTMQARSFDGACGALGKFWERRHDILAQ
jgi:hypothetical protein